MQGLAQDYEFVATRLIGCGDLGGQRERLSGQGLLLLGQRGAALLPER